MPSESDMNVNDGSESSQSTHRDRKGGLSCAECRRSKLRCDRSFPCQACIRRGCAAICPDGTLAATKGNKVLVSRNETLQQQVKTMKARIQELEAALKSQPCSKQTHPHLQAEFSHSARTTGQSDDKDDDLVRETAEALGSLSIGDHGVARFHGETAGSEYLQGLLTSDDNSLQVDLHRLGLPQQVLDLVNAFPFGVAVQSEVTKEEFFRFLPPRQRAQYLSDLYYANAAWMYDPVPKDDFMSQYMKSIYEDSLNEPLQELIHCHELSVFFLIMAIGSHFDEGNMSSAVVANQYYALSCAVLSLSPIVKETTCATIQALFLVNYFLYLFDRQSMERRWLLTGIASRLAYRIGLQRDVAGWNLNAAEKQRRRIVFWELFTWDSWTSVVFGRPPSLGIHYTDCHFPEDRDPTMMANGDTAFGFHAWKYRNSAVCFAQSVQYVFSTKTMDYKALLELDRKIRKFQVPPQLQCPMQGAGESTSRQSWSQSPGRAMMQYCLLCCRESNLMYIHRSCFAQAIKISPSNPLNHKYGASLMAVYRSACILISTLRSLHGTHPKLSSRVWFFWSGVFSAVIVLSALVIESPGCNLSGNALFELDQAISLYAEGSKRCRPPGTLEVLTKLQQRAQRAYAYFFAGQSNSAIKTRTLLLERKGDQPDDLLVALGGSAVIINSSKQSSNASSPITRASSSEAADVQPSQRKSLSPSLESWNSMSTPSQDSDPSDALSSFGNDRVGGSYQSAMQNPMHVDFSPYYHNQDPSPPITTPGIAASVAYYDLGQSASDTFQTLGGQYQASNSSLAAQNMVTDFPEQPTQEEIWQNFLKDLGLGNR